LQGQTSRGQKKKLIRYANLWDWIGPFLSIGDDVAKYNFMMGSLESSAQQNNVSPEVLDKLKKEINQIRHKHGLATFAQLKDMKELGLKPIKYPGDPDPVQPITTCKWCGSALNEKEKVCHNCGQTQISKGKPYQRKVPDKGESPSPFGTNRDVFVNPYLSRAAQSKDSLKRKKKDKDNAEQDDSTAKDVFVSDPFNQCLEPKRFMRHFVDRKEEVMKSCRDLEIDG